MNSNTQRIKYAFIVALVAVFTLGSISWAAVSFVGRGLAIFDSIRVGKNDKNSQVQLQGPILNPGKYPDGKDRPINISDNLAVKGKITSGGLTVTKRKVYKGTVDFSVNGDIIKSIVNPQPTGSFPNCVHQSDYHWKSIAVPEIKLSNMPIVQVFGKLVNDPQSDRIKYHSHGANSVLDFQDIPVTTTFSEGKINFLIKQVNTISGCQNNNGVSTGTTFAGEYQIVVHN